MGTVVVGVVAMVVVVVGGIVHIFSEWYLLVGSFVCAIVVEVVVDVTANGVVIMGVVVPKSLVNQVVKYMSENWMKNLEKTGLYVLLFRLHDSK